jgi:tRNA(Ile2) C34 agmatinyltransferase TiaS
VREPALSDLHAHSAEAPVTEALLTFAAALEEERYARLTHAEKWARWRAGREAEQDVCAECGGSIRSAGRSPFAARYCSDACKMRAYRNRKTA